MIVCTNCGQYFKISRVGVMVAMKSKDRVHAIYSADLKECPGCKTSVLASFGGAPIKQAHEEGFDKLSDMVEFVVDGH